MTITVRMADVATLRLGTTGLERLRALAGPKARPLGHDRTAEFAFLAVEAAGAVRQFVFLPSRKALVEYDIAESAERIAWKLEGAGSVLSPLRDLHLIQTGDRQQPGKIDSDDLAGLRLGEWAILFYTEPRMARSAVSFDVEGPAKMKFLIAGLAPGAWEIWHAGMRAQDDGAVAPQSGVLHFEGK